MEGGHHRQSFFQKNSRSIFYSLLVILFILFLFNTVSLLTITKELKQKTLAAEEANRLPVLQTLLLTTSCKECENQGFVQLVSPFNVTESKEIAADSSEGKELIAKYNIEKLPSFIIQGEIDKSKLNLTKVEDSFVVSPKPPYVDAKTGETLGLVSATLIQPENCEQCFDLTPFVDSLKQQLTFKEIKTLKESEANELITKYNLVMLPALLLSSDADAYDSFKSSWERFATIEQDGTFSLKKVSPPYKELSSGKITGLVSVTYLVDPTCKECYNVTQHKSILTNSFGVKLAEETTLNVKDATSLVQQYNITKVPTIILSKEIQDYSLKQVLGQVGTYEQDGSFVFRQTELLGAYKDISSGKIVTPPSGNQQ